eukprot:g3289.t1
MWDDHLPHASRFAQAAADSLIALCLFSIIIASVVHTVKLVGWKEVRLHLRRGRCWSLPGLIWVVCVLSACRFTIAARFVWHPSRAMASLVLWLSILQALACVALAIVMVLALPHWLRGFLECQARLLQVRAVLSCGVNKNGGKSYVEPALHPLIDTSRANRLSFHNFEQIVGDVVFLSRRNLENIFKGDEEEFELQTLISQIATYWTSQARRRKTRVVFSVSQSIPALALGPAMPLCQLLHQLLATAVERTDAKGPPLFVECKAKQDVRPASTGIIIDEQAQANLSARQDLDETLRQQHPNRASRPSSFRLEVVLTGHDSQKSPILTTSETIFFAMAEDLLEAMGGKVSRQFANGVFSISLSLPLKKHLPSSAVSTCKREVYRKIGSGGNPAASEDSASQADAAARHQRPQTPCTRPWLRRTQKASTGANATAGHTTTGNRKELKEGPWELPRQTQRCEQGATNIVYEQALSPNRLLRSAFHPASPHRHDVGNNQLNGVISALSPEPKLSKSCDSVPPTTSAQIGLPALSLSEGNLSSEPVPQLQIRLVSPDSHPVLLLTAEREATGHSVHSAGEIPFVSSRSPQLLKANLQTIRVETPLGLSSLDSVDSAVLHVPPLLPTLCQASPSPMQLSGRGVERVARPNAKALSPMARFRQRERPSSNDVSPAALHRDISTKSSRYIRVCNFLQRLEQKEDTGQTDTYKGRVHEVVAVVSPQDLSRELYHESNMNHSPAQGSSPGPQSSAPQGSTSNHLSKPAKSRSLSESFSWDLPPM